MRKILAIVAAALLAVCSVGVAVAAASEPAPAYGGCVSKSTGYLRVLERNALAKSVNGACKSTERKITFPSRTGLIKGDKGATGASAYEVWRDLKDSTGAQPNKAKTLTEFLASLKGETGAKGDKGADGKDGRGFDAPFKMTFDGGTTVYDCTWNAATSTLACAKS